MAKKKSSLEKTINKQKKAHPVAFLLVVLFLVVGAVAGYFVVQYLTKDDRFEIIGEQTITLNIGETYEDEGAIAISFGRDISDKIKVENNINNLEAGRYYIKYTIDDIRYSGVVKYRYIIYLDESDTFVSGDFEAHFMELGNQYAGDCIYIRSGSTDILIDAGSRKNSADAIIEYVDEFVKDNTLEFVIATHADQDHIAAYEGIFEHYNVETIIDFPLTNKVGDKETNILRTYY